MRDLSLTKRKIKTGFRDSTAYSVALGIRRGLKEVRKEIGQRTAPDKKVVFLYPEGTRRGKVLFSYIIDGFLLEPGAFIPKTHTNIWQSLKMAETFVKLGYEVHVIHYTNRGFVPKEAYSYFVDVRHNLERLSPLMNKDCVKIMHLDTASILFHNAAGAKRL